jgi:hypothetical protein
VIKLIFQVTSAVVQRELLVVNDMFLFSLHKAALITSYNNNLHRTVVLTLQQLQELLYARLT